MIMSESMIERYFARVKAIEDCESFWNMYMPVGKKQKETEIFKKMRIDGFTKEQLVKYFGELFDKELSDTNDETQNICWYDTNGSGCSKETYLRNMSIQHFKNFVIQKDIAEKILKRLYIQDEVAWSVIEGFEYGFRQEFQPEYKEKIISGLEQMKTDGIITTEKYDEYVVYLDEKTPLNYQYSKE